MGKIVKQEYKGITYYYDEEDGDRFYLGYDDFYQQIALIQRETRGTNIDDNVIRFRDKPLFVYKPCTYKENNEFIFLYMYYPREHTFESVIKTYAFYYEDGTPKIAWYRTDGGVSNYDVERVDNISDLFINRHNFIIRRGNKDYKDGGIIYGIDSGHLSKFHNVIKREYDAELLQANFGEPTGGKNLLYISDTLFPLDEFGLKTSLEEITYCVDADTMKVISPIYSLKQNKFIEIKEGLFQKNGVEYPAWAKGLGFDESDFDSTIVYEILKPRFDSIFQNVDSFTPHKQIDNSLIRQLRPKK